MRVSNNNYLLDPFCADSTALYPGHYISAVSGYATVGAHNHAHNCAYFGVDPACGHPRGVPAVLNLAKVQIAVAILRIHQIPWAQAPGATGRDSRAPAWL